jgi:hypothetical protein
MNTLKIDKNKDGYKLDVFDEVGKLVDWRNGLTKKGFEHYKQNFERSGYLSATSTEVKK